MKYIAILGFGVVGSGCAEVLTQNEKIISKYLGEEVSVKYILDLREFPDSPFGSLVVHDFNIILNDSEISVIVETMGGAHPAYDFTVAALSAGKNVVTSNKEVVSKFGAELLRTAAEHKVRYLFEASVGGGIPVIRPMMNDLKANKVISVNGILNGTTNYILTRMKESNAAFSEALAEAQQKGYAEKDPTADVCGHDAARKISILAAISFGKLIHPDTVYTQGIDKITSEDTAVAEAFGYSLKLIGHAEILNGKVFAMVSPRLVPPSYPLYSVSGVFNGIIVNADMVGKVMFYGQGAGKLPTASAVVADIIDIIKNESCEYVPYLWDKATENDVADMAAYETRNLLIFDSSAINDVKKDFAGTDIKEFKDCSSVAIITLPISEEKVAEIKSKYSYKLKSVIRLVDED